MDGKLIEVKRRVEEIYRKGGAGAVERYVEENIDQWKNAKVSIAVTGGAATGKSTFINGIRGVRPSDKGFAQPGFGDTTKEPRKYKHPTNDKIEFIDLPGFGTLKFPMSNYIQTMKISDYDYFLIFFDKVISENDVVVAKELKKMEKPFCFVRSKVDVDYENAIYDGRQQDTILSSIHQSVIQSLANYESLKADAIFVISGRKTNIGETPELLEHMEKRMPVMKYESIMRSLDSFSADIIEKKYQLLKSSLYTKSLSLAFKVIRYDLKDLLEEAYTEYLNAFNIKKGKQSIRTDQTILSLVKTCEQTNLMGRSLDLVFKGMISKAIFQRAMFAFPAVLYGVIVSYRSNAVKMHASLETILDKAHNLAKEDYEKHVHSKL
ncbi:unnamed protein product [Mytilus coruscus]|uniref:IRG-type G domain-containing protein n=1 Tax=Mytilus coruscus TaxID=42192 RepID=A0A6J8D7Q4_MYTCO|nr:unnamed protein product [Mytilus coruscus]